MGLETGTVKMTDHMPIPCTGGMQYGIALLPVLGKRGHGYLDLTGAIAKSCDVYFYQLGLKLGLARLRGRRRRRSASREGRASTCPRRSAPRFPESIEYFDRKYGKGGWTQSVVLSLAIGQGENSQTILNMAKFYTALATDGTAARPQIVHGRAGARRRSFKLTAEQLEQVREALVGVVDGRHRGRVGDQGRRSSPARRARRRAEVCVERHGARTTPGSWASRRPTSRRSSSP